MSQDFEIPTPDEDDEQTRIFLRTNGPEEGEFEPNIPPGLLKGKSESEKWMIEKTDTGIKQNGWLIKQVVGLKGAIRAQQRRTEQVKIEIKAELKAELAAGVARFQTIESKLEPLANLWDKWLGSKKVVRHLIFGLLSLFLLPFLALFMVELLKHWLGWK